MKTKNQPVVVSDIDLFRLSTNTVLNIRVNDPPSSRYKSIELKRQNGDKVKVTYRDFAGSVFNVDVSLSRETATLTAPDLACVGAGESAAGVVVKHIQDTLAEHRL